MRSAAELGSFILGSLKDEEAGRVALYHFLKNFHEPEDAVTPELINGFFAQALLLPYWQEKRQELYTDIRELLQKFFTLSGAVFTLDQLWNLPRMQLILLNHIESLYLTVRGYEQSRLKEGESLRVLPDGESRVVTIKKLARGEINVRTYSNLVRIHGAGLAPISHDQELHYNAGLELQHDRIQHLKPAPHSSARFIVGAGGIAAQFISGYAFRQTQTLKLPAISQEPRLFYPLKRLERFYVYRPSDPYYIELIGTLDRAIQMIHSGTEGAMNYARSTFEGGQIAFDQIFPDDKQLYGRLKELARLISYENHPQRTKESATQSDTGGTKHNQSGPTP
jgi:hypothetical protein